MLPADIVRCMHCNRMNTEKARFCNSCANPINVAPVEAKSRPRAATPRRFQSPAPARGPLLVARETYDATDPITHKVVHVIAGRTRIAAGCWLHKTRPSAFAAV